jgi:hypothetical protein
MAELEINNQNEETLPEEKKGKKPTPEEVKEARKEFEDRASSFNETQWTIGTEEDSLEYIVFLKEFLRESFHWKQNEWMGLIKMDEELTVVEGKLERGDVGLLQFGYQALEFLYYALTNPGGTGLESAKLFEKKAEKFNEILTKVADSLDEARKELKEIQFLQEKWATYESGFYLEREDGVEEPEKEEEKEQEEKE